MQSSDHRYTHRGWFVPGKLNPGWDQCFRQNLNDMRMKFQQLGIRPFLPGLGGDADLGVYFSQAQYSFVQFLSTPPPREWSQDRQDHSRGSTQVIVAYSLWMSAQGWSSFSPVPLLSIDGHVEEDGPLVFPPADPEFRHSPFGWYLIGELSAKWQAQMPDNLSRARDRRRELGIVDVTPFYVTQSNDFDCIQVLQSRQLDESGLQDRSAIMAYARWFNAQEYGRVSVTPLLGTTLVESAIFAAQRNP